jgi:hypothetical protein
VAEGALQLSEQALATLVLAQALSGSVYLGDRNFGIFSVAQAARHHSVWVVLRMTRQRAHALAGRQLHSGEERLLRWRPSAKDQLHPEMSPEPIQGRVLFVRLVRNGFRPVELYLFTTLLDTERYPLEELVQLYGLRWHVELDLRYVKTILEMELLTGKTVDIVRKELHAGLLAYNLIRGYMVQAAQRAGLSPLKLSFTRCWRRVRDMLFTLRPTDSAQHITRTLERLWIRLTRCTLPNRPRFRIEPRAVHQRPDVYPKLRGTRAEARQRIIASRQEVAKS